MPKGFEKGRVEHPIQITKEVHAEPQLQKEPWLQKEEHPNILSQNDEPSELEVSFIPFISIKQNERI